jgi:multicomponent K+:H+ antiporter subunit D
VLAADRLRTLIAYLVILSVGTLLAGVGRMTDQGLTAALYYLPHTTLVTGGLFLLTEPIARLRGQWGDTLTKAPATVLPTRIGMLFFLGAVAAAGLPPLSGFIGKLVLLRSVAPNEGAWLWGVVLGTSLLAMVGLSRAGSCLFWGTVPSGAVVGTIDMRQLLPASLLLAASVVLALAAAPICDYAEATARQLLDAHHYIEAVLGADKLGGAP